MCIYTCMQLVYMLWGWQVQNFQSQLVARDPGESWYCSSLSRQNSSFSEEVSLCSVKVINWLNEVHPYGWWSALLKVLIEMLISSKKYLSEWHLDWPSWHTDTLTGAEQSPNFWFSNAKEEWKTILMKWFILPVNFLDTVEYIC